jgi:hypothetical protein
VLHVVVQLSGAPAQSVPSHVVPDGHGCCSAAGHAPFPSQKTTTFATSFVQSGS